MISHDDNPTSQVHLEQVKRYHQQTKHEFNRFSRSLGYLDWANQPDPFRRFRGAPLISLPRLTLDEAPLSPAYESLFHAGAIPTHPITLVTLSRFFEYALSLTAWKEYNTTRWALRSNPSSGNLHPTEGYLFVGELPQLSLKPGLYHYAPKEHALEQRWSVPPETAHTLLRGFPAEGFLVGLTSIHWREAWKYGERAFRYCQHDIGHAIGTMRIAAATLGWNFLVLADTTDEAIEKLLGLHRQEDFQETEPEYGEIVAAVWPGNLSDRPPLPLTLDQPTDDILSSGIWEGKANRLSKDEPVHWAIIEEVTEASWKWTAHSQSNPVDVRTFPQTPLPALGQEETLATPRNPHKDAEKDEDGASIPLAGQIIHQRRSAVAFDGHTGLPAARFFTMLGRIMPQGHVPVPNRPMPWDALPWNPTIHFAMFVHRIQGLVPGLYWLNRNPTHRPISYFQPAMHQQFLWKTPEGCPTNLPLYLLEEGNAQNLAMQLSCGQDIASDSAFALGMVAEFDESLEQYGPWFYKRLFWETGLIGQILYLEAEASGIRSTGIGCFFDDPVHRVFGFYPETTWQSLYHFTVGGPREDSRLTTLPPYGDHVV